MPVINTDLLYSVREFAQKLGDGTSDDAVRKHCSRGVIEAIKVGNSWLIPKTAFRRFQKERRSPGRPPQ